MDVLPTMDSETNQTSPPKSTNSEDVTSIEELILTPKRRSVPGILI